MSRRGRNGFRINAGKASSVDDFVCLLLEYQNEKRAIDYIIDLATVWLTSQHDLQDFVLVVSNRVAGNSALLARGKRIENRLPARRLSGKKSEYFDPAILNDEESAFTVFFDEFSRFNSEPEIRRYIIGQAADWAGRNIGRLTFFTRVLERLDHSR